VQRFRPSSLGNRITVTALAIAIGTVLVVYVYTVAIGGAASGQSAVKAQILVGGLFAVLATLGVGIYFARIASGSIQSLQEAARKVADGNFETPIPISSAGQLGQLARTFNEMQRRLAELDSARKQFIANASHELRTPIFSLGGFVELLEEEDPSPEERDEFIHTMRQQIERLTKLTADLLDLSQLDAGAVAMKSSDVDIGSLAREVTREFGPRADHHGSSR
jgi:signal transduction histidine kinase